MALERALAALRRGEFILVYDGDGREEETDLTIASEFVKPESVRTLRKEAGGLICTTLSGEV
ncbi:MAG: 3,4-dihydroxy-2-butanone-4-phosphate synthase, partial [Methanobacteriota archaeon]